MIHNADGNLLEADVDALVNTVNTVGVMGKGIALQFKQAFPGNFKAYAKACKADRVQPGSMFVYDNGRLEQPKLIINFPTKRHWRSKSRIEDIESGLVDLIRVVRELRIESIALPPLGCGNGGLDWSDVEPLIVEAFSAVPDVDVHLFAPVGTPQESDMRIGTARPPMTVGKAALVALMARYQRSAETFDGVSQVELQKLMYFQQAAGELLNLKYAKAQYGPYADNLNFVLQRIEGHFVRGAGGRSRTVHEFGALEVLDGAWEEAESFLSNMASTTERMDEVLELVAGFESPYGLELLSSVHWIATNDDPTAQDDLDRAIAGIRSWNRRKDRLVTDRHITVAWNHLRSATGEWLSRPAVA